jgi:septum formation protein
VTGTAEPGLPRLVLASRSPRRAEILRRLGLEFEVEPSDVDESLLPGESARDAAERLAGAKAAASVAPGELVLACDTIVALGDEILNKPESAEDAVSMLGRLSGREHVVYTGIALATPERTETAVEATRVRFRRLSERERREYVATGEPMDKAGAYGIQAFGAALVEGIEGDYFNVMGLPVQRFLELLGRFGWRYAYGRLCSLGDEATTVRIHER